MNALLSQAADLRAQAHTLAEQALFGDLFADTSAETIAQLNAQADALEAQAAVVAPAPAPAPEPSPAEQLDAIFEELLSPVSDKGLNMNLIDIKGTKGAKFYRAIVNKLAGHPSIVKATVEKNENGDYMVKATGLSISDEEIFFTLMFSNVSSHGADITLTASSSLLDVNETWDVNPWTLDARIAADQIGMLLPTIL